MALPPEWTQTGTLLGLLIEHIDQTQAAALASIADASQADELVRLSAELAQKMGQAQPLLATALARQEPPPAVRLMLGDLQARLGALRETTTRLEGATQRALGVLFPAEQARAYERLAPRGGAYGARGIDSAGTSLKA